MAKLRKSLGLSGTGSTTRRAPNKRSAAENLEDGNEPPTKLKKSLANRRRSSSSDEESEAEDIKLEKADIEDDEAPKNSPAVSPVPTRAQQPRRAKAEMKKYWVDSDSDDSSSETEADGHDSTDEENPEAPRTPETDHSHEELKLAQTCEAEGDCIAVAPASSSS